MSPHMRLSSLQNFDQHFCWFYLVPGFHHVARIVLDGLLPIIWMFFVYGLEGDEHVPVDIVDALAPSGRACPKQGWEKIGQSFPLFSTVTTRDIREETPATTLPGREDG